MVTNPFEVLATFHSKASAVGTVAAASAKRRLLRLKIQVIIHYCPVCLHHCGSVYDFFVAPKWTVSHSEGEVLRPV